MTGNFPKVLIFGCGNMGGAMLRGWLTAGVQPERFIVVDPVADNLPEGVALYRSASELSDLFDTVLLGIKPQMLASLGPDLGRLIAPGAVVLSLLAGSRTDALSSHFTTARIVRLMPNLAAAVGKSPLGLFSKSLNEAMRGDVETILAALGTPIWLGDESQMDAVTALAGSGPAFVYRFIDALAQGGAAAGLPADVSAKLALSMVEGAALLAASSHESPSALAERVTSPGGTTAAGLAVLDKHGALAALIEATLLAARDCGAELAKG